MKFINEMINDLIDQHNLMARSAYLYHLSCERQSNRKNQFNYYWPNDFNDRQRLYARARQLREQIIFLTHVRDELTIEAITIIARHDFD